MLKAFITTILAAFMVSVFIKAQTGSHGNHYSKQRSHLQSIVSKGQISNTNSSREILVSNPFLSLNTEEQDKTNTQTYDYEDTRKLANLVNDAAMLVSKKGEAAFKDFRVSGSRWRQGETYIFVIDTEGNMLVHADTGMENKNQLNLKDIHGKPIIKGLIHAASTNPEMQGGWFHYQWTVPSGLLPRWKSSYVKQVKAPSGKSYIVGSGTYNDRMERAFVVDMVQHAVKEIEANSKEAYKQFHDPAGPFLAKDAYVFVVDENGVEVVNPPFPNLEGRNLMELKDAQGKFLVKEMFKVVKEKGSGWVEYMWPKPGESISTQKSTYVAKAKLGDGWVIVGAGVYLADAPKAKTSEKKLSATELTRLVKDAAAELEKKGEKVYPDFRKKGSRWFTDNTYLFVWSMDGIRVFHAATPESEGKNVAELKDILGRPMGRMFLDAAASKTGEGWVHYMWPEPGDIFPTWKSSFLKKVTFPSGKEYIVGSGIYNMQMDKVFIEDLVNRAADLVAQKGKVSFTELRDKSGPYYFMETYVFVENPQGVELVNGAYPVMEGMNFSDTKDPNGKYAVRDYIDAAKKKGSAWTSYHWYKPGDNKPTLKHAFVRKVQFGGETYIVGSGYYEAE